MNNWPMKLYYSEAYRKRGVISLYGYSQVDLQKGRNVTPSMLNKFERKATCIYMEDPFDVEDWEDEEEDWSYIEEDDEEDNDDEDYI